MTRKLLIIGQHADLHVQAAVDRLGGKFDVHVLDQFDVNDVCPNSDEKPLKLNSAEIDFCEPILIWNRIKLDFRRVKDNREETAVENM